MTHLLMTVDAVGGVWQYAVELAAALRPLGTRTTLALLGPPPSAAQRTEAAAAGVTLVETGLALDWLAASATEVERTGSAIAALARDVGADVVQLNQPALASTAFDVPVVAAMHSCVATWWDAVEDGPLPEAFAWQTALVARGLSRADAIVCPTAAFAAAVRRVYRLAATPAVVHNGRSPVPSAGAPHDFAFTAGRLWDRGKDAATLDRAAARLGFPFKAAGPLAGPNGEQVMLANLNTLGAVDSGVIDNCLSARPIFVSAAPYEPFGLAVLEAASAGCALVLSDIATFRELWDGAATFVAPGDDAGFTAAIEALAADPAQRLAAGERARRASLRYTPAAMAAGLAAVHTSALRRERRAAA